MSNNWFEVFSEDLLTQVIGPFLISSDRMLTDLPSLLLTCKFIYGIFKNCDEFWKKLFEKDYKNQLKSFNNSNIFEQYDFREQYFGKGKLMKAYFEIKYYEKHLNLIPKECLMIKREITDGKYIPQILSGSNEGYIYAEGFCSQLTGGYFIEGYDPSCPDIYRCNLDGRYLGIFSVTLSDEMQALIEQYLRNTAAMVFTVVILHSDQNFDALVKDNFGGFERICALMQKNEEFLTNYPISFGIHFGGKLQTHSNQYKQEITKSLRRYLSQFNMQENPILECNLYDREQVRQLTRETLNMIKPINLRTFLPVLLNESTTHDNKNKKKCLLM